tara:strand:+ start:723 stop:1157 length:435 start_codon:yes stop_codon:yes gene_type:complete
MALSSKKHEKFYATSGGGADEISTKELSRATAAWNDSKANGCKRYLNDPMLAPIVYQLQQMQDEIDYLRTEISDNKDKTSMTLGTTSSTALAGDTKLIGIGANTTVSFGEMTQVGKGYTIDVTVTRNFGGKTGSVTKSTTLTLT